MNAAQSSPASGPHATSAAPGAPAFVVPTYHAELVSRAASLLWTTWPNTAPVQFTWWVGPGVERSFIARWDWPDAYEGQRVVVIRARSGEVLCRSLRGKPFDIDPQFLGGNDAPDQEDRELWEDAGRPAEPEASRALALRLWNERQKQRQHDGT